MGGNADVVEVLEDVLGDPVVDDALAFDHLMLFGIEGGRVVLEMLDQGSGLGSLIEDLRLAFIDSATAAHRSVPWLGEIHVPWLQFSFEIRGGGSERPTQRVAPPRRQANRW